MRTYRELKEDFESLQEINKRHAETLDTIAKLLRKRNEEIAKLKIENRYLTRKVSEYDNYFDRHKGELVKFNDND